MTLKLIQQEINKNKVKTEFKIPVKEFKKSLWLKRWLRLAGSDLENPPKRKGQYVYFTVDGDYINGKFEQ